MTAVYRCDEARRIAANVAKLPELLTQAPLSLTTNMRTKKLRDHDLDDGDEIVPTGGRVRVNMTDAAAERQRWIIRDAPV